MAFGGVVGDAVVADNDAAARAAKAHAACHGTGDAADVGVVAVGVLNDDVLGRAESDLAVAADGSGDAADVAALIGGGGTAACAGLEYLDFAVAHGAVGHGRAFGVGVAAENAGAAYGFGNVGITYIYIV